MWRRLAAWMWLAAGCNGDLVPLVCRDESTAAACLGGIGPASTPPKTDAGTDAQAPLSSIPWGTFAAGLDVPPCPAAGALVVDTTADDLDGDLALSDLAQAGPTLSLREAMTIAANRAGPDTIFFDEAVFPVAGEATIHLDARTIPSSPICLDGRHRGVVIDWPRNLTESECSSCIWSVMVGSLQVGLTLNQIPQKQRISGGQIAGCRTRGSYIHAELVSGTVGPGNVFSGTGAWGVIRQKGSNSPAEIRGNFFGYDPLLGPASDAGATGIMLFETTSIRDNVFANPIGLRVHAAASVIEENFFGVDRAGNVLRGLDTGVMAHNSVTLGPSNQFRGYGTAILASAYAEVTVTRNSITGNDRAFRWFGDVGPPQGPTLTSITAGNAISGMCPVSGTVELFTDPGDQGEVFVGSSACEAGTPWTFTAQAPLPSGRNVTATLTSSRRTSTFSAPLPIP